MNGGVVATKPSGGHWPDATIVRPAPRWVRFAAPVLSVAIIVAVAQTLGHHDLAAMVRLMPASPLFWIGIAVTLSLQPVADFLIFRLLWPLPPAALAALFRKTASNELLFGYSGELQFYLWARRHAALITSPFAGVRDVSVLSALVGNAFTLALLVAAYPMLADIRLGALAAPLLWSAVVLIGSSLVVMVLRRHLFGVSPGQFRAIAAIHLLRAVMATAMIGALWYLVLPEVAIGWWVLLSAARMFVGRLPFLPNKDLVFAGLATSLVSADRHIVEAIALVAGVLFAGQVVIGFTFALADLIGTIIARGRPA
ncbi:hypothetical protein [uncultured Sphingomonas sp.]|uniref:hypothetical protein n=1 Tax=uncultured Sphingomonas sp. TaxID=158754 RepID=UPI0035CB7D2A